MFYKRVLTLLMLFILLVPSACGGAGGAEPTAVPVDEPVSEPTPEPTEGEAPAEEVTTAGCPEATAGVHQLIDAANGICFLYPDNYDVFQGEDGSLALYVRSLLNTEAPFASIHTEALNGRSIQEIIPDYPSDADLAAMSFLTIDLGGEQAIVLDNLPGQDINRRAIAVHEDRVVDVMVARIGEEYGEVGRQAEALYQIITETFQFIGIEPEAHAGGWTGMPGSAARNDSFYQ